MHVLYNFRYSKIIIKNILKEDDMKKVLSLLAISLMLIGVTGCMDDPNGSKQKVSSTISL